MPRVVDLSAGRILSSFPAQSVRGCNLSGVVSICPGLVCLAGGCTSSGRILSGCRRSMRARGRSDHAAGYRSIYTGRGLRRVPAGVRASGRGRSRCRLSSFPRSVDLAAYVAGLPVRCYSWRRCRSVPILLPVLCIWWPAPAPVLPVSGSCSGVAACLVSGSGLTITKISRITWYTFPE